MKAGRAAIGIDTTHMPPNIEWHPDLSSSHISGTLSYRRAMATKVYSVVAVIAINLFVVLIVQRVVDVMLQTLSTSTYNDVRVLGAISVGLCCLAFIALDGFYIYRALRALTDHIQIRLSANGIDCTESFCNIEKSYHFPLDETLKVEQYVAYMGRNREFTSIALKAGKTVFAFGALSPVSLKWLEATLKSYIAAQRRRNAALSAAAGEGATCGCDMAGGDGRTDVKA